MVIKDPMPSRVSLPQQEFLFVLPFRRALLDSGSGYLTRPKRFNRIFANSSAANRLEKNSAELQVAKTIERGGNGRIPLSAAIDNPRLILDAVVFP